MQRHVSVATVIVLSIVALLLGGCTGVPIKLKSEPPGATVLADGKAVGVTPMEMYADEHFPAQWTGWGYERQGKLTFERVGCETKTLDVDTELMSRSIRVKLECDPNQTYIQAPVQLQAPVHRDVPSGGAAAEIPIKKGPVGAAERLEELNELRDRGLISEEEYQALRRRVLDRF